MVNEDNRMVIERNPDFASLRWPVAAIATGEDGESFNRGFQDMRGFSWREVSEVLEFEDELLKRCEDDPNRAETVMSNADMERLYSLDLGIASTVVALSAAKCYPITSCNASGSGHAESYPLVLFRCRQARAPDILAAAEDSNCGLENGSDGTLIVYGGTVRALMRFAQALIDRRASLKKIRGYRKVRLASVPANQLKLPL